MLIHLRPLNNILIGEFIDLEKLIKDRNIIKIAEYLYAPRMPLDNVPYDYVIAAYKHYLKWRNDILNHYYPDDGASENNSESIYTKLGLDTEELKEEDNDEELFYNQFGWYSTLFMNFANEDYTKMPEVFKIPVIQVFNHLLYLRQRAKYIKNG